MYALGTAPMLYVVEGRDSTNMGLCLVDDELGTCFCGESDRTDLPLLCALLQPRGVMCNTGSRFCGPLVGQIGANVGFAREARSTRHHSLIERAYAFMADGDYRLVYKVALLPASEDLLEARGPLFLA